jgi:hypothetical protein
VVFSAKNKISLIFGIYFRHLNTAENKLFLTRMAYLRQFLAAESYTYSCSVNEYMKFPTPSFEDQHKSHIFSKNHLE